MTRSAPFSAVRCQRRLVMLAERYTRSGVTTLTRRVPAASSSRASQKVLSSPALPLRASVTLSMYGVPTLL